MVVHTVIQKETARNYRQNFVGLYLNSKNKFFLKLYGMYLNELVLIFENRLIKLLN